MCILRSVLGGFAAPKTARWAPDIAPRRPKGPPEALKTVQEGPKAAPESPVSAHKKPKVPS
eukprot:1016631-Pyramimonas_sp.AAC.1